MQIKTADRLNGIGEYYFSAKLREIDAMNRQGDPVINLGIGSPDLPPHPDVIQTLAASASGPGNHAYQSYKGAPALRTSFAHWYQRSYGVTLDPDKEILPLIGSKEGILHICMTYLNPGDEALIPDPGYPTYTSAVRLAGGTPIPYTLSAANNWAPDFAAIEKRGLKKVKCMWVNYPHMPTGQAGNEKLFEEIVAFGLKHEILICHDNPYSFILNDHPMSLLQVPGAKETVIELNSLSKSHNMAGWRIGMVGADAARIDEILRFKSNMDSGMFLPLQLAAARALELGPEWFTALNEVYAQRRKKLQELLGLLDCQYDPKQVGMFLWAKVPDQYTDGFMMSDAILQGARVFLTPGGIFGENGKQYIRISLCGSIEKFSEAIQRIQAFLKPSNHQA
ncbi:MAG TPA: aminotransferase class I/II-fold pyridoxal phosphate-dependent enzyme [Sediminibacterium sp.]|nr:aminotransferase class I/II-fold pyridoxal phosphate-dependent enzyme [Sediminibacterium sp.]